MSILFYILLYGGVGILLVGMLTITCMCIVMKNRKRKKKKKKKMEKKLRKEAKKAEEYAKQNLSPNSSQQSGGGYRAMQYNQSDEDNWWED
jgi:predicted membrane protein